MAKRIVPLWAGDWCLAASEWWPNIQMISSFSNIKISIIKNDMLIFYVDESVKFSIC